MKGKQPYWPDNLMKRHIGTAVKIHSCINCTRRAGTRELQEIHHAHPSLREATVFLLHLLLCAISVCYSTVSVAVD